MPNARSIFVLSAAALALGACNKQQPPAANQNIAIDEGVPSNQVLANSDIETLPADESSETPSTELENGYDNPDVNDMDVQDDNTADDSSDDDSNSE
jgi:hypothetical protein